MRSRMCRYGEEVREGCIAFCSVESILVLKFVRAVEGVFDVVVRQPCRKECCIRTRKCM